MKAIRKVQRVKAGSIKIDLPAEFNAKKVEIIVLPIDETNNNEQSLQDLLLDAPTLTNDEFEKFDSVRDWMGQWNVKEF